MFGHCATHDRHGQRAGRHSHHGGHGQDVRSVRHGRGGLGRSGDFGLRQGAEPRGGLSEGVSSNVFSSAAVVDSSVLAAPAASPATVAAEAVCPMCENHCPLSAPGCGKGRAYAARAAREV